MLGVASIAAAVDVDVGEVDAVEVDTRRRGGRSATRSVKY